MASYRVMYIGSTELDLRRLEYNHRNARNKVDPNTGQPYTLSKFRRMLEKYPKGKFGWIYEPRERTRGEVEDLEGRMIRKHRPVWNIDKDPIRSSIRYGRDLNDHPKMRGVYAYILREE